MSRNRAPAITGTKTTGSISKRHSSAKLSSTALFTGFDRAAGGVFSCLVR